MLLLGMVKQIMNHIYPVKKLTARASKDQMHFISVLGCPVAVQSIAANCPTTEHP